MPSDGAGSPDGPAQLSLVELLARHELLPLAWQAASASATFLRDERPADLRASAKSTPTDAVTEMDTGSERILIDRLLGARPQDGLLGEEGGERTGSSGVRWVVDPLDGTVSYLYRWPTWGVSVAAEIDGLPAIGVVLTPDFDEGYVGIAGKGAWLVRGDRATGLRLADATDLSMALVATGFGYAPSQRANQAEVLRRLLPRIRDLRRSGSAVVDFCWLARGRLDAYFEEGLHPWDLAAGALIATEAGAAVQGVPGPGLTDGTMLAARPGIFVALREALLGSTVVG